MNKKASINKKALSFDLIWQLVLLILLILVTLLVYFLISSFSNIHLDTDKAEAKSIINRIYYSEDGFVFFDGSRYVSGVIDVLRFNKQNLNNLAHFDNKNKYFAAKLTLYDLDMKELETPASTKIGGKIVDNSIYLNRKQWLKWEPLTSMKGSGATKMYSELFYVLIADNSANLPFPGFLSIRIILPRS